MTSTEAPDIRSIQWRGLENKRDVAVAMAKSGFAIVPLRPNQKAPPMFDGWQHAPLGSPDRVERTWTDSAGESRDNNIAVVTGNGLLVLDFDAKKGGVESYYRLTVIEDRLPGTFHVATQGGGYHVYLHCPEPLASGVDVLDQAGLPGVDLRAAGGYVVGPGSTVEGRSYQAVNDHPVADAPRWLLDALAQRRTREKADQQPVAELDSEEGTALAREWLKHEAPTAVEGANGDATTYAVAARLRDFAISEPAALALMLDHWNEHQSPPWAPEDLERKVANAYNYGTATPGKAIAALPHHEFEPLPQEYIDAIARQPRPRPAAETDSRESAQTPAPGSGRYAIKRWPHVRAPAVQWLIQGLIPERGFATLFGQPGSYKSFVALHAAATIAAGRSFLGKATRQGDVLYLAAEGGYGLRQRLDAIESLHQITPSTVGFIDHPLDLRSTLADCDGLLAALAREQLNPSLIVIDTLARSFGGGNENASEDMGAFIAITDYIRAQTGSAILAVHHSGKDTARGMRGHSSLFGAIDAELEVERIRPAPATGAGSGGGRLRVSKQKDGPDGFVIEYAVEKVLLGAERVARESDDIQWADDTPERSSLAIREYRDGEARALSLEEIRFSDTAHKALDRLREMCAANESGQVSMSNWRRSVMSSCGLDGDQWKRVRGELKACRAYRTVGTSGVHIAEMFRDLTDEKQQQNGELQ